MRNRWKWADASNSMLDFPRSLPLGRFSGNEYKHSKVYLEDDLSWPLELVGWQQAAPEDPFIHTFAYLNYADLNTCASVCKSWQRVAYDGTLWRELDLSKMWYRVNDKLVINLLKSPRFRHVVKLRLEGCEALTDHFIEEILKRELCGDVKIMSLIHCRNLTPPALVRLVRALPALEELEIYGVVQQNVRVGRDLLAARPGLRMPLFWLRMCGMDALDTETGQPVDLERCRHNGLERACWGAMVGRVAYSNLGFDRPGNFPHEVLYSCQTHDEEDFKDEHLLKCEVCNRLFREESMATELVCNTCFDQERLRDKSHWVQLTKKHIDAFCVSDILNKAMRLTNLLNMPHTLVSYGLVHCTVDYRIPESHEDEALDLSAVPITLFRDVNARGLSAQLSSIRTLLLEAKQAGATRALLSLDENKDIEVFGDTFPLLDGRTGEMNLTLAKLSWANANTILFPFIMSCVILMFFIWLMKGKNMNPYDSSSSMPVSDYSAQLEASREETVSIEYVLIMAGVLIFTVLIGLCVAVRYRTQCLKFLKIFIFLDLLLLFMLGSGMMLFLVATFIGLPLEIISTGLLVWNFGCVGMYCLYHDVPEKLQQFFLVSLFVVMGVMMAGTLNEWICFFFVLMFAMADAVSMWKPQWQLLSPFSMLPTPNQHLNPAFQNPRILYPINGATLRSFDFLWVGLAFASITPTVISAVSLCILLLGTLVIDLFVGPFVDYMTGFRPTPMAFLLLCIIMLLGESMLAPCLLSHNMLTTTPIYIGPSFIQTT